MLTDDNMIRRRNTLDGKIAINCIIDYFAVRLSTFSPIGEQTRPLNL
jgi:hypothetical protein